MDSSLLRVHIGNAFNEVFTPYNAQWPQILLVGKAQETGTTGDPAWCSDIAQCGINRQAGQCDIGAFEVESSAGNNTLFLPLLLSN